ncbi:MAG: VWA domain-containing protein [Cyanobacteria bacterium]|nr:VWA domain-containing protein [Cyanobacteriota bacterium]
MNNRVLRLVLLSSVIFISTGGLKLAAEETRKVEETEETADKQSESRTVRPKMDLAFCIDTTGSMEGEISLVKDKVKDLVAKLCSGKPAPIVRVGLVAYRDTTDDYVTKVYDFTGDIDKFVKDISALSAQGGGDEPEAVDVAIRTAVDKLKWDSSKKTAKLLFLIGDAGPHSNVTGWESDCRKAIASGIQINTIGCDGLEQFSGGVGTDFFQKVAKLTDGSFETLAYRQVVTDASGGKTTFLRSGGRSYELTSAARDEWKKGASVLAETGKARPVTISPARRAAGLEGGSGGGFFRTRGSLGATAAASFAPTIVDRRESNLDSIMYGAALKKSRETLDVEYK